jgi:hypothetical protein
MNRERGSALITVVLVVFVLTMVGIAGVLYMTVEDKISGNDKLAKAGFYAAESGLRVGEQVITSAAVTNPAFLDTILTNASHPSLNLGDGGFAAVVLKDPVSTKEFYSQTVPLATGARDQATYTLYVRNNSDDPSGLAGTNHDKKVNLIAVGSVVTGSGQAITKILEEQMDAGGAGGGERLMKGQNFGGTSAAGIK